jgi:lysophospholipase L1-like esterase
MGSVVALFGDSQIARLAISNLARRAEDFGISGDRLEWLQQSLPRYDLARASAVVFEIGVGDLEQMEPKEFGRRYRALLRMVPAHIPVVAIAVLPMRAPRAATFATPARSIRALNRQISAACAARQYCTYLDAWDTLADRNGDLRSEVAEPDGLHLSARGSLALTIALDRAL